MNKLLLYATIDESHKNNVEQKKSETNKYIRCTYIYIKFKNDKTILVLKVRVRNWKKSKNSDQEKSAKQGFLVYSLFVNLGDDECVHSFNKLLYSVFVLYLYKYLCMYSVFSVCMCIHVHNFTPRMRASLFQEWPLIMADMIMFAYSNSSDVIYNIVDLI